MGGNLGDCIGRLIDDSDASTTGRLKIDRVNPDACSTDCPHRGSQRVNRPGRQALLGNNYAVGVFGGGPNLIF